MKANDLETCATSLFVWLVSGLTGRYGNGAGATLFDARMIVLHEVALGVHLDANFN